MNYEAPLLNPRPNECGHIIQSASKVEPICSDASHGQSTSGAYEVDE